MALPDKENILPILVPRGKRHVVDMFNMLSVFCHLEFYQAFKQVTLILNSLKSDDEIFEQIRV